MKGRADIRISNHTTKPGAKQSNGKDTPARKEYWKAEHQATQARRLDHIAARLKTIVDKSLPQRARNERIVQNNKAIKVLQCNTTGGGEEDDERVKEVAHKLQQNRVGAYHIARRTAMWYDENSKKTLATVAALSIKETMEKGDDKRHGIGFVSKRLNGAPAQPLPCLIRDIPVTIC